MAPDFEAPRDQGGDNVYDLIVTASDGTQSTPLEVTVTVTDVNEAPRFAVEPFAAFATNPFAGIDVGSTARPPSRTWTATATSTSSAGERFARCGGLWKTATGFSAFATNPFADIDVGFLSTPAFADLDGDGDLDLVVGANYGTLLAFEKTATGFAAFATNPFAGIDVGNNSAPAFATWTATATSTSSWRVEGHAAGLREDLDGLRRLRHQPLHRHQGQPQQARPRGPGRRRRPRPCRGRASWHAAGLREDRDGFAAFATNPVAGIDVGFYSKPAFADLDGDGDLDLVVGAYDGTLRAFENQTLNPRVTFTENGTGTVFQRAATDPEGSAITWSLGGADAALFDISSAGAVTFQGGAGLR